MATNNRYTFQHNNLEHLETRLKRIRNSDSEHAIFVITEGLYSMHGDAPNAEKLVEICKTHKAILILDVSHDFGAQGEKGLGMIEQIPQDFFDSLVVCGSFSKSFATTGGFVIGPKGIRDRLVCYSPTYMFTFSITPMCCGVINKALEIAFSEEGLKLRKKLKSNASFARACFKAQGISTIGNVGPVLPVLIGDQQIARLATKKLFEEGVLVNLIEFPAVPLEHSMFRVQISAAFSFSFILDFAKKIGRALTEAKHLVLDQASASNQEPPLMIA